jgi:hypothetical protein
VSMARDDTQGGIDLGFRLPLPGFPRVTFHSDFSHRNAELHVEGERVAWAYTKEALVAGVEGTWGEARHVVAMRLVGDRDTQRLVVTVDGQQALSEDHIWAKPSRTAWIHAFIALGGSAAGFLASVFYLVKAHAQADAWALKMGNHTAGWHILLTLSLFPASVWGQRIGIRAVQVVSFVFFCIHVGIALANSDLVDPPIAFFNALSGVLFLVSTVYGNRAYRDMSPDAALRAGRV